MTKSVSEDYQIKTILSLPTLNCVPNLEHFVHRMYSKKT